MSLVGNNVVAIIPQTFYGIQPIIYPNVADSTSTTTGGLVCNSVTSGKTINSANLSTNSCITSSTSPQNSSTTGSLSNAGGLGVNSILSVGGNLTTTSDITNTNTLTVVLDTNVTGTCNIPAGIFSTSGFSTGVNTVTPTNIYTIVSGTRGFITLTSNIASPCMLLYFFEWTSGISNACYQKLASSGNALPSGSGMGSGGTLNIMATCGGTSGEILRIVTVSGSGSVNYTVTLL